MKHEAIITNISVKEAPMAISKGKLILDSVYFFSIAVTNHQHHSDLKQEKRIAVFSCGTGCQKSGMGPQPGILLDAYGTVSFVVFQLLGVSCTL